jgi:hypothetical protein
LSTFHLNLNKACSFVCAAAPHRPERASMAAIPKQNGNGHINGNGSADSTTPLPELPVELWRHPNPTSTPMWRFIQHVNAKYGFQINDYAELYRWSIADVGSFWEEVWHFGGILASQSFEKVRSEEKNIAARSLLIIPRHCI